MGGGHPRTLGLAAEPEKTLAVNADRPNQHKQQVVWVISEPGVECQIVVKLSISEDLTAGELQANLVECVGVDLADAASKGRDKLWGLHQILQLVVHALHFLAALRLFLA